MTSASVAIFAPNPLLTVTLELEGGERQSIHFHAGGQGVWVAGMVGRMGATPVLCGFIGGESGQLLRPLIEKTAGGHVRLVADHQRERLLRHRPTLRASGSCSR